jgi:SsrA-binding protein
MKKNDNKAKLIANNKKAYYDYFIEEKYEAGICLTGTEVKSLRQGKCSIKESYIRIENNEVFIIGMHIAPYDNGNIFNHEETRTRKLLLNKSEIRKLSQQIERNGYTIVPLQVYFSNQYAKVEIGLAKGKKNYDKRESIKNKDVERQIARSIH